MNHPAITLNQDPDEIHGKRVRYRLIVERYDPPAKLLAEGIGTLCVVNADDGKFMVYVMIEYFPDNPMRLGVWGTTELPLDQEAIRFLRPCHLDSDGAELECLVPVPDQC